MCKNGKMEDVKSPHEAPLGVARWDHKHKLVDQSTLAWSHVVVPFYNSALCGLHVFYMILDMLIFGEILVSW